MYKIIYSDKTESHYKGDWPSSFLQKELEAGKDLIVISTYSDTVKVPFFVEDWQAMRVDKWEFRNFPLRGFNFFI